MLSYNQIAYRGLEVCNPVEPGRIEAAVERTGLGAGARAADVGTGTAALAIRLARRFGFAVTAIEYNPDMAALARANVVAAGAEKAVEIVEGAAADVLTAMEAPRLIVALGTTNVTGEGLPTPESAFAFLRERLPPGGWLLWGDLTWTAEPPAPLRQITDLTNLFTDDAGWKAAAAAAGLELTWSELSPQPVIDAFTSATDAAVRAWLEANPEAPEAAGIRLSADRVRAVFGFGRPCIGFGLYLFRRPPEVQAVRITPPQD
ncbi:SAM-dependent methyltransferase [Brevundimonas viscosa]|nr:methyltransferase domain-containing protein [Brevundimonas viscosa]